MARCKSWQENIKCSYHNIIISCHVVISSLSGSWLGDCVAGTLFKPAPSMHRHGRVAIKTAPSRARHEPVMRRASHVGCLGTLNDGPVTGTLHAARVNGSALKINLLPAAASITLYHRELTFCIDSEIAVTVTGLLSG